MGRNKKENPKNKFLQIRLSDHDLDLITRASDRLGLSLSSFVRGNSLSAALLILGKSAQERE